MFSFCAEGEHAGESWRRAAVRAWGVGSGVAGRGGAGMVRRATGGVWGGQSCGVGEASGLACGRRKREELGEEASETPKGFTSEGGFR